MEDFTIDLNGDSVNAVFYELHFSQAGQSEDDLNAIRDVCLGMVAPLMEGYIWQREAFQLSTSAEEAPPWRALRPVGPSTSRNSAQNSQQGLDSFRDGNLPCLWGAVQFGDNLEDEWFITWLLQQLTLQIPGAAARVWDNDGEFLLIEAAYSLPRWLKPETSTNRVWLAGGKLHVVPLPSAAVPDIPSFPTLTQALQLVRSEHVPTLAGSEAQGAIQARLRDFQKGRHKHMHRARVIVPTRVAALLAAEAQFVAPAVEAFHYRDVDDMRAARRMQHFPAQDMVNVVASFSRCLYAQLEQQQFEPPKGYPLPLPDSPQHRAAHLGMKLTCGFEMLYARREHHAEGAAGNMDNGANASTGAGTAEGGTADTGSAATGQAQALSEEQIADNPSWRAYKSSLERNGYFKDNIPGSQEHRKLMQAALQSFVASEAYKRSTAALAAPVLRMQDILARPIAKERLEEEMQGAEDDDSWMRDGAAELERELAARQAELDPSASDKQPGTSFDPEDLAERMKAFVEKESSFEGAELPASAQREGVSLDSKRFWAELGSALGMQPGDRDRSDSEDEGSSFFGGGSDEDDDVSSDAGDDVSREPDEANVYQGQRAQRAQNGQAFHKTATPNSAAGSKPEETSQTVKSQQKQAAGAENEKGAGIRTQPPNGASHALQGIKRGFLAGSKGATRSPSKPAAGVHSTAGATTAPHVGASKAAASSGPTGTTASFSGATAPAATSAGGTGASKAKASRAAASSAARMGEDEQWEVLTATDSDDEPVDDADFMAEYGERMERELGRSKVGATFERTPLQTGAAEPPVPDRKGKGKAAADVEDMGSAPGLVGARTAQPTAGKLREEEDEGEELQPVDIDLNLVQSLLASYAGQQGLPGPVSNLAGLMGLHLPDDEDSRGKSAFDAFLS